MPAIFSRTVLVVGGLALAATGCGSSDESSGSGTGGSGLGGGGGAVGGGGGSGATSGGGGGGGKGPPPGNPGPLKPASGSSGCGLDAAVGTFHQSVDVGGVKRTFFVSVHSSYDKNREYPIVFGYHGGDDFGGEKMRGYLDLERIEPVGSEIFVYPDATAVNDPNGSGFEYGVTPEAKADDAFFDEILKIMSSNYCIDENRVFVTGQSAGGGYVAQLACHRGDVIKAAVPVAANIVLCNSTECSGWGGTHPSLCKGKPNVMQMHSPSDYIDYKPFGLGTFEYLATPAGCGIWNSDKLEVSELGTLPKEDITPPTCQRRKGCDREMVLCSYTGGHQIPGFSGKSDFEFQPVTMDFFRSQ